MPYANVKLHHLTTGHLSFHLLPPPWVTSFTFLFFFPLRTQLSPHHQSFALSFLSPHPCSLSSPPLIILQGTKGTATDSWTILGSHERTCSLLTRTISSNSKIGPLFFSCTWRKFTQSLARLDWMWQSERERLRLQLWSEIKSPPQLQGALGLGNFTVCHLQRSLVELVW